MFSVWSSPGLTWFLMYHQSDQVHWGLLAGHDYITLTNVWLCLHICSLSGQQKIAGQNLKWQQKGPDKITTNHLLFCLMAFCPTSSHHWQFVRLLHGIGLKGGTWPPHSRPIFRQQYKHEKVHASDDKSIKMNHATLIMKQNAAARWHCNAEYLMQRRISDVIFNDWQKKLMFQIPCHHSALLGTIPHFFRHFCVLIGQPVSP